jgi:PadR family transcriptional regulator, regulatory protein PadR
MAKRSENLPRVDMLQGTLDMLILQVLLWSPQHGHGIGQALRAYSADALQLEHGSLYPALHRLERRGWVAAEWRASEANRRAKYYRLTTAGRKQLVHERSRWQTFVDTVARVIGAAPTPTRRTASGTSAEEV